MTLIIDNYDSFTFNLFQMFEASGERCLVRRNDQITIAEIEAMKPARLVLSPGPGEPRAAGVTLEVLRAFAGRLPNFGVCLGHQAIGEAFGARVVRAPKPVHGKRSRVHHDGRGVFSGLKGPIQASRYHSLVISSQDLPECLEVTARTDDGLIMGVRHREHAIEGVQFHPESFATEGGVRIIRAFLARGEAS